MEFLKHLYFKFFDIVSGPRREKRDVPNWIIHVHIAAVMITGVIMWAYTYIAYTHMGHSAPFYVGLAASLIHNLSVFVWRFSNSPYLLTNIPIAGGFIHQTSFAYFDGGFHSVIVLWYCILPIFGGVVAGIRGIVTWGVISTIMTSGFLIAELAGYPFPKSLSTEGHLQSLAILVFGLLASGTGLIVLFVHFSARSRNAFRQKADQVQDLLRVLIHDVTNPMIVAQAQIEMMLSKEEDLEKRNQRLHKARTALNIIENLTNRVRNYHAEELDKTKFRREECSINECVEHIKSVFEAQLLEKDIQLVFDGDQDLVFKVNKDIFKNQILMNLTSNAIKFTEPGGKIVFGARKTPGQVHIFVKDSGVGMNEEALKRFKKFGSAKSTQGTVGEKGTGFGLRIVRSFVDKLDGGLDVYSQEKKEGSEDHGTEFVIKLPA